MKNPTSTIFITRVGEIRTFVNFHAAAREIAKNYPHIGIPQAGIFYPRGFVGERYDWRPITSQVRDETYLPIPKWKLKELLLQDGRFYFKYVDDINTFYDRLERGKKPGTPKREVCVEYWTHTRYHRGSQKYRRRSHHKNPRYVGALKDRERFLVDCEDYGLKKPCKERTEHWLDYEGYYGDRNPKNWKRFRKTQYKT